MKMINNVERIKKLKEENYQKIFGIKKNTFDKMLKLLNEAYRIEHLRGGHPPKLSVHTIVTIELWKILPLNMVLQKVPSVSALNGLKTS